MSKSRIYLFGHSHLTVLEEVYRNVLFPFHGNIDAKFKQLFGLYHPFVKVGGPNPIYHPELEADLVADVASFDAHTLFGSITGSEPFVWAVQGQSRPFDVLLPDAPHLPLVPNAEILPYTLIHQIAEDQIVNLVRFYRRAGDLTGKPVYQIIPPPAPTDDARVARESPEPFRTMMQDNGVPSGIIRYKLWLLWVSIATKVCKDTGVGVIMPPEIAIGSDGLLIESYSADCVHANASYANLVWQKIESVLK